MAAQEEQSSRVAAAKRHPDFEARVFTSFEMFCH